MTTRVLASLLALSCVAGCIPSNVVAPADRTAGLEQPALAWGPATAEDIPGLYRSISIEGVVAATVRKLYYFLAPDGSFTGSILLATSPARFEVVAGGRWSFANGELRLGAGSPPARLEAAADHLRLIGGEGQVVLRREATH